MEPDVKQQFQEIKSDIADFFGFVRDTVATKEDLKAFATKEDLRGLERKMDDGFGEIRTELRSIDDRLTRLEMHVAALAKGSTEDIDALANDYIPIRRRLEVLEEVLRKHGMPVPPLQPMNSG